MELPVERRSDLPHLSTHQLDAECFVDQAAFEPITIRARHRHRSEGRPGARHVSCAASQPRDTMRADSARLCTHHNVCRCRSIVIGNPAFREYSSGPCRKLFNAVTMFRHGSYLGISAVRKNGRSESHSDEAPTRMQMLDRRAAQKRARATSNAQPSFPRRGLSRNSRRFVGASIRLNSQLLNKFKIALQWVSAQFLQHNITDFAILKRFSSRQRP